jgi:hypothetical protein
VLLENIIHGFCQDCNDDEKAVHEVLPLKDWNIAALIVHRLAGRLGQMGILELAASFRNTEFRLRTEDFIEEQMITEIFGLLRDLNIVVKKFETEWPSSYSIS